MRHERSQALREERSQAVWPRPHRAARPRLAQDHTRRRHAARRRFAVHRGDKVIVTQFRSISMPAGFRRHFVGKTLVNISYCDTA